MFFSNSYYLYSLKNCFRALEYAKKMKIYNFENLNIEDYQKMILYKNGCFTWIVENKLLIFSFLTIRNSIKRQNICEKLIKTLKQKRIEVIIRLNKPNYEKEIFKKIILNFMIYIFQKMEYHQKKF